MAIVSAMTALNIPYEVYHNRKLGWTLSLIQKMIPKEKKKTTAQELNEKKKVEVKLWQPKNLRE